MRTLSAVLACSHIDLTEVNPGHTNSHLRLHALELFLIHIA